MIIDQWRELLTGQKTAQRVWLRRHQSIDRNEKTGEKSVKHSLSNRSKLREGAQFLAVAPGRFPAIMVGAWRMPNYTGAAMAMDYCFLRDVFAGGQWYIQTRHEAVAEEYDLKPGWFKDDFEESAGGKLSVAQLQRNGFERVSVTINGMYESDIRQMSPDDLRREGYPNFLSMARVWCNRIDRKVSRRLANIASRDGIPAAEQERLTRRCLADRPDEFYRCAVLEISL